MPSSTCAIASIFSAIDPSSKSTAVVAVLFSCRPQVKLTSDDDEDDDDQRGHQLDCCGKKGKRALEDGEGLTRLRGDKPAKKQTVTQSIEN